MKTWKIAIIGCGDIAENVYMAQMRQVCQNTRAEVVACCDIKPERVAHFEEKFGIKEGYDNIDSLLSKCDFDILMNTTSIPSHYELNMKVLKAGKHLYSQKPIGLTVKEATDMIDAANAAGVKFAASPIHMLRPDIKEAKDIIKSGAIGKVLWARAMTAHGGPEYFQYRVNDPSWFYEPGAGALYDLGVHALHMITGILGPASEVAATAAVLQPRRIIRSGSFDGKEIKSDKLFDNYMIHLRFKNGSLGDVMTGFCVKASQGPSLEIFGEYGTIAFTNKGLEIYIDCPDKKIRGWIERQPQERPAPEFYQCSVVSDLIDAIEKGRPVGLPAEHARHVIELMCKIEECAKDGERRSLETIFSLP